MNPADTKKTILYESHISLGAKMAPFGGYEMPIQYEGIFAEHFATRQRSVIFDTCHMGEFSIYGETAAYDLDRIISCPVADLKPGQCRYGFICNPQGGVIDDQIVYRLSENEFFMVVNASTQDADFEWIKSHLSGATFIRNLSSETGKVDVQGPMSAKVIAKLTGKPIDSLKYYHWMHTTFNGRKILISRTGYTGEIGFEIYLDVFETKKFWDACLDLGVAPAGLGARDTLRLEMGYPLYGHELDSQRNAAEAGFSRAIGVVKEFIGSAIVRDPSRAQSALCGMKLDGRRAARNNDEIFDAHGAPLGIVTSGSYSPSLECACAMGYVKKESCDPGSSIVIRTGKAELSGKIVALPFYPQATARKNLCDYL
jgi:aminomethyltransferase